MKLKVLGCFGGNIPGHGMTSLLLNDSVALDAGWVSGALSLRDQEKVKDIFISHSHLDHTCTLPFLIDNNFSAPGFSLRIYAIPEVVASMKNHLFNNQTWPDFTSLPNDLTPVLKLVEVRPEEAVIVNGLTIRPVLVSHLVPTAGFIVEDKKCAIAFSSDTGPTHRFWELVNGLTNLKDVPVYLYGGKPKHLKAIKKQVAALKRKKLSLLEQGRTYRF
jgi:ribonuclease BN (tRNA processing enzyme)